MKCLSIQLQTDINPEASKEEAISILSNAGFSPEINEGEDNGRYINLNIETDNLKEAWSKIKNSLIKLPRYAKTSIVVCEGSEGWDNYLLLHHFDQSEKLDEL